MKVILKGVTIASLLTASHAMEQENKETVITFHKDFVKLNPHSNYVQNDNMSFFSASNVRKVPESISTLQNLTNIDLFFCPNLTALPESIGTLTNLTKLSCVANELKSLPNSLHYLTNLTKLNLNNSLVTRLPIGFLELKKLDKIMLFGTPLAKQLKIANTHDAIDSKELEILKNYVRDYVPVAEKSDHEIIFEHD